MTQFLYFLPLLTCPIVMGAMMFFMMRGNKNEQQPEPGSAQELVRMRAEIDQLRAQQRDDAPRS